MNVILSIDVGIVNLGLCLYEMDDTGGRVLYAIRESFAEKRKDIRNDLELTETVYKKIMVDPLHMLIKKANVVIIERQMKREMIIIQHVIAALCMSMGKPVEFIAPQCVKRWFRKASLPRQSHRENKRESIHVFTSMYPQISVDGKKKDDIADAVLQAAFWCDRSKQKKKSVPRRKQNKVYNSLKVEK
jgi:hypothetical protein